ncbi:MAG: NVEALA domain-containing protein [Bacteroidales bacterium]|nr:NVEALA domain-containing protein [Bacteroidales bacterium]
MKKIFGMVAIAVVALAATMNVRASLNGTAQLSDLQLENIEALAAGEGYGNQTADGMCRFDIEEKDPRKSNCNYHSKGSCCPDYVCHNR